MTKDEALKKALEALKTFHYAMIDAGVLNRQEVLNQGFTAATAIKEALMSGTDGAQPEQEPVTWRYKIVDVFGRPAWTLKTPKSDTRVLESQPLYTTPPQRKPLTDEEIENIWADCPADWDDKINVLTLARAIEAAHGIKEKL